jgi:hypothetical protein
MYLVLQNSYIHPTILYSYVLNSRSFGSAREKFSTCIHSAVYTEQPYSRETTVLASEESSTDNLEYAHCCEYIHSRAVEV